MIAGLQKMTLLDFPGKVACTVFLQGCNFRCPFCHNSGLLGHEAAEQLSQEAFFSFLEKRTGILDGVCVTGGEPTLQKELPAFLARIKAMGFAVKLDTNGSNPQMLQQLIADRLVDYVAMDIKNSPASYGKTAGLPAPNLAPIEQSIRILVEGDLPYEFRTTTVRQLHTVRDFTAIGQWICSLCPDRKIKKYFLQIYTHRDSVLCSGLSAPETADLQAFLTAIAPYADQAQIRGDA